MPPIAVEALCNGEDVLLGTAIGRLVTLELEIL